MSKEREQTGLGVSEKDKYVNEEEMGYGTIDKIGRKETKRERERQRGTGIVLMAG